MTCKFAGSHGQSKLLEHANLPLYVQKKEDYVKNKANTLQQMFFDNLILIFQKKRMAYQRVLNYLQQIKMNIF